VTIKATESDSIFSQQRGGGTDQLARIKRTNDSIAEPAEGFLLGGLKSEVQIGDGGTSSHSDIMAVASNPTPGLPLALPVSAARKAGGTFERALLDGCNSVDYIAAQAITQRHDSDIQTPRP